MKQSDLKALLGAIDPTTLSQEELDRYAGSWNDRPIDDFCGLSPVQMDALLYNTLGGASPIRVRKEIAQEVFEGMPFFRLVEELVAIVAREEEIRLTATGALPPRFVRELYAMRIMPQFDIERGISKLSKEADWPALQGALTVAEVAGLLRTVKKKRMVVTREGAKRLEGGSRRDLFIDVLRAFTGKLNWAYFDLYESQEIGRFGWGYTAFLLLIFGEKSRPVEFYAELYRRAFPMLYSEEPEPGRYPIPPFDRFVHCYGLRSFSRFFGWFGWIEGDPERLMREDVAVVAGNGVFRRVFETEGKQE